MPKGESPESLKKNKSLLISSFMSHLMSREPGAITKLVIVAPPLNAGGNGGEMAGKRGGCVDTIYLSWLFLGWFGGQDFLLLEGIQFCLRNMPAWSWM
jgi:hypothetical protein